MRTFDRNDFNVLSFRVNEKVKKGMIRRIIKTQKIFSALSTVKNILLPTAFIAPILFLIYAYQISDGFVRLNSRYGPIGTKNHLFIWTCAAVCFCILFFLYFSFRVLYNGLTAGSIAERYDESLVFENNALTYGYKLKMQSYSDERVTVTIPIDSTVFRVDNRLGEIVFKGNLYSRFFTAYSRGEGGQGGSISEITLYDYFEPSLITFLTSKEKTTTEDRKNG